MSKEHTGPLSMKSLDTAARDDADTIREQRERQALALPDGRSRRKVGRTASISLRTFPSVKQDIHDLAEAAGKDYVQIVEEAVALLKRAMKGER